MIALLDYGAGNLHSVHNALVHVGAEVRLVQHPEGLGDARAMVLPGVGAFDDCLNALRRQALLEAAREWIRSGRPFLGICVGYQALFDGSDEFNSCAAGLGVFKGRVVRFPDQSGLKVPQIGWNQLEITAPDCPMFRGIDSGSHVYFVHSYHPLPEDPGVVASWTTHGVRFASSVWKDNLFATQFHPEKSQGVGLRLLANFMDWARHL